MACQPDLMTRSWVSRSRGGPSCQGPVEDVAALDPLACEVRVSSLTEYTALQANTVLPSQMYFRKPELYGRASLAYSVTSG